MFVCMLQPICRVLQCKLNLKPSPQIKGKPVDPVCADQLGQSCITLQKYTPEQKTESQRKHEEGVVRKKKEEHGKEEVLRACVHS